MMCYMFSQVDSLYHIYGCETWTYSNNRPQNERLWNVGLLKNVEHELGFTCLKYWCTAENVCKGNNHGNRPDHRKMSYMRATEGRRQGKWGKWRPRLRWVDDLRHLTGTRRYDQINGAARKRQNEDDWKYWMNISVFNLTVSCCHNIL